VKTIIIGLGNPILSDDSVGIKVARILQERVKDGTVPDLRTGLPVSLGEVVESGLSPSANINIDVVEIYAGGIRLMDAMVGYERAVIIDAMVTGKVSPGSLQTLPLSALISTRNMACMHDTNISTALELGKMIGLKLPDHISIFGIEAKDVETFSEELTEEVEKAVPEVVENIIKNIFGGGYENRRILL